MTTFQAVLYAIIHGFTEFLPVSSSAHQVLVPYVLGWPEPSDAFLGALKLGALLALLGYFRHDWASIISSFLQVLIFRKRPMTLDERLPWFLFLTTLPAVACWYYFHDPVLEAMHDPLWAAAGLAGFGLPLWFSDRMSRRNKGMFDWNWLDALVAGIGEALMWVPGCGRMTGILSASAFRNYNREAAAKYALYASAPLIAASAYSHLHGVSFHSSAPMEGLSWLTFAITVIVTLFASLLAIGGLMKESQRKGFGGFAAYRLIAALAVAFAYWVKSRG